MRSGIVIGLLCSISIACLAQSPAQIQKIIPASPNTAALGKYGEIPVSLSTGIPNISVPLYTINAKDISLPIELNYHASGVKVEEISSWVGLGWSLNAGGVITRQVRGLPDDDTYGLFNIEEDPAALLAEGVGWTQTQKDFITGVLTGVKDSEPDIFYYNFAGKSGKFLFNKTTGLFETIPLSRMKIVKALNGWDITAEDGMTFGFYAREENAISSFCEGSSSPVNAIASGWNLSVMRNPDQTDSIVFNYVAGAYSYATLRSAERFFTAFADADCNGLSTIDDHINCLNSNSLTVHRLSSIDFRGGKIKFLADSLVSRCDLSEDHALKSVVVKDDRSNTLFTYELKQSYFGQFSDVNPCDGLTSDHFRLKLDSVNKISGTKSELYRAFEYNTSDLPSRMSFAQDFWGYYNGQNDNSVLYPTTMIQIIDGFVQVQGANRFTNDAEVIAQAGILTKMTYPTGGYTEFEYENNTTNALPSQYIGLIDKIVFLDILDDTVENGHTVYEEQFVVTEDTFVDIIVDGITCTYGPEATVGCAEISLNGPQTFSITENLNNRFLSPGTYTLKADFQSNPNTEQWQEFVVRMLWQEHDTATMKNNIVGGLRIKKMTDYDFVSGLTNVRSYKYHLKDDTTTSSSRLLFFPNFTHNQTVRAIQECPPPFACEITYNCPQVIITATSNYPVAGQGSNIIYSFVTEELGPNGIFGKNTYKFSDTPDIPFTYYPFPPSLEHDWLRGQLLEQTSYVNNSGTFTPLQKIVKTYPVPISKELTGVKAALNITVLGTSGFQISGDPNTLAFLEGFLALETYEISNGYVYPDSTITYRYSEDTTEVVTTYEKNFLDVDHLNIIGNTKTDSKGGLTTQWMKYPENYSGSGSDTQSLAIQGLRNSNRLNYVIEQSTWKKTANGDSVLMAAGLNLMKTDGDKILVDKTLSHPAGQSFNESEISSSAFHYDPAYEKELEITEYDSRGNIVEGVGRDGITMSFQYDANNNPVCIAKGASSNQFFYNGFEETSTNTSSDAKTGSKSYSSAYTVNPPSAGTYQLTYFQKTGSNPWQFISANITSSVVIGGSGNLIDEVRVAPAQAQVTTYTYVQGVGVSSITDVNNLSTYYSYDSMGRLIVIKDNEGNIQKRMKYHYINSND